MGCQTLNNFHRSLLTFSFEVMNLKHFDSLHENAAEFISIDDFCRVTPSLLAYLYFFTMSKKVACNTGLSEPSHGELYWTEYTNWFCNFRIIKVDYFSLQCKWQKPRKCELKMRFVYFFYNETHTHICICTLIQTSELAII